MALQAPLYSPEGNVVGESPLSEEVFGVPRSLPLLHQVVLAWQANQRHPWAHTKTRAEVRGGGKKPWKQKGTGRARHGSIRSPIWKGGGVAHGPRNERIYAQKINKKMASQALRMALSDKAFNHKVVLMERFSFEPFKTKTAAHTMGRLPGVLGKRTARILVALGSAEAIIRRVLRNIPGIEAHAISTLHTYDVMKSHYCIFSLSGVKELETRLSFKS
jgi:large subunit ribosomal protein L4